VEHEMTMAILKKNCGLKNYAVLSRLFLTENYLELKICDKYFFYKYVHTPTRLNVLDFSHSSIALFMVEGRG
jgi:hypothetical protein